MKPYLRLAKLSVAFFLIMVAAHFGWATKLGSGKEAMICFAPAAIGLAILWQDWRTTRN
jgi:hypothetical protein